MTYQHHAHAHDALNVLTTTDVILLFNNYYFFNFTFEYMTNNEIFDLK